MNGDVGHVSIFPRRRVLQWQSAMVRTGSQSGGSSKRRFREAARFDAEEGGPIGSR